MWAFGLYWVFRLAAQDFYSSTFDIPLGRDFANLYTAGKVAVEGATWRLFDLNAFRFEILDHVGKLTIQNYSYPPHALFIAVPFSFLPYQAAFIAWTLLGAAFFYWAARPLTPFAPVLAILTPAAAMNMWAGHYGFFLGGLWLLYFRWLSSKPVKAGIPAALLTFKPHMGLFIAATAFSSRKALLSATLLTLTILALSVAAFGLDSWAGFFTKTFGAQIEILNESAEVGYFKLMPSAYTALGRNEVAMVAQAIVAAAAILIVVKARKLDPFILSTATFLVVPYVFVYDMTVACLGFAIKIWNDWGELNPVERTILSVAFLTPCTNLAFPQISAPILLAALCIQCGLFRFGAARPALPASAAAT
jgi:hypothetical protein